MTAYGYTLRLLMRTVLLYIVFTKSEQLSTGHSGLANTTENELLQTLHRQVHNGYPIGLARSQRQLYSSDRTASDALVSTQCPQLPITAENKWIIAENAKNGLCNQLIGIYSYAPVAMLWGLDLIVGDIFSRESFELKALKYDGWTPLSFKQFFDWDYFHSYWLKRRLHTISLDDFKVKTSTGVDCLEQLYSKARTINRYPLFYSNKKAILMQMLALSNISFPIAPNTILRFDEKRPKFTALFNFWKGGLATKMALLTAHRSLKPAAHIRQIVADMRALLPPQFLVAHIRLEGDYLLHERTTFDDARPVAIDTIRNSKCLKTLATDDSGRLINPPVLYVASGLFNATVMNMAGEYDIFADAFEQRVSIEPEALHRARVVVKDLRRLGFTKIVTRDSLSSAVQRQKTSTTISSISSNRGGGSQKFIAEDRIAAGIASLYPEQQAWVDLLMSRQAECFIAAHYESSFSYLAQRMRILDNGQVLKFVYVTEETFGASHDMKDWGV